MYLQIVIGEKKPVYYKLHKNEVLIGSLLVCDITVHESSISKRHLKLFIENSHWQIIDNGSTNGTFIYEERIVPGKRIDFSDELEIRLGGNVFLKKVKDIGNAEFIDVKEKPPTEVKATVAEKTTVLSLDDFKAAEALAKKKKDQALAEKRRIANLKKRKDQLLMIRTIFIVVALFSIAYYVNKNFKFFGTKPKSVPTKALENFTNKNSNIDKIE